MASPNRCAAMGIRLRKIDLGVEHRSEQERKLQDTARGKRRRSATSRPRSQLVRLRTPAIMSRLQHEQHELSYLLGGLDGGRQGLLQAEPRDLPWAWRGTSRTENGDAQVERREL